MTRCPDCGHELKVHAKGRCRAWLKMNERCPCTHEAVKDARAALADVFEGR